MADPFAGMYGDPDAPPPPPEQPLPKWEPPPPAAPAAVPYDQMDAQGQLDYIGQIEDEELRQNMAAADAALAREQEMAGIKDPFSVAGGQAQGLVETYADLERQRAGMGPRVSSAPNQAYPIIQRRMGERVGTGQLDYPEFQPEPWQDLPRYEGESDEDWRARNQIFAEADFRNQADDYMRQREQAFAQAGQLTPDYDTRQLGGVLGFEDATRQSQERVDQAQQAQDQETALAQAAAVARQADATTQAAEAMDRQRQHEQEAMQAVQQIRTTRDEARVKLAAMPEIDRHKVAKGLSAGTKIASVLGAMAQGWRGDAITAVNDAIDRGVADEMAQYERARAEYGDIVGQVSESMGMLDFLVTSMGGNVRAAAQTLRQMRTEDALSELDARIAQASLPTRKEQMMQARVALEQQLRGETDAMEMEANTTPRNFIRVVDPYRADRRAIEKQQEEIRGELKDIRKDVRGSAEKATDRESAVELEGVKARGAAEVKRAEKEADLDARIKERSIAFGTAEQMIDEFLADNPDEIHGTGVPFTGTKAERINTDSFRMGLKQTITQAWTGASATPEQQVEFQQLIEGDWSEFTDDEFRARLRSLKQLLGAQRRYLQQEIKPATPAVRDPTSTSSYRPGRG